MTVFFPFDASYNRCTIPRRPKDNPTLRSLLRRSDLVSKYDILTEVLLTMFPKSPSLTRSQFVTSPHDWKSSLNLKKTAGNTYHDMTGRGGSREACIDLLADMALRDIYGDANDEVDRKFDLAVEQNFRGKFGFFDPPRTTFSSVLLPCGFEFRTELKIKIGSSTMAKYKGYGGTVTEAKMQAKLEALKSLNDPHTYK